MSIQSDYGSQRPALATDAAIASLYVQCIVIPRFILLPRLVSVTLVIMFCSSNGFLLPGLLNKDKRFLHTSNGWPIFVLGGFWLPVSGFNLPGLVVRRPTSPLFLVGGQTVVRGPGLGLPVQAYVV